MLNFLKVIMLKAIQVRQIRHKGLINYCENATYYTIQLQICLKKRKEKEQYTDKQKKNITCKQLKTKLSLSSSHPVN